jgi:hypothetical protein
MSRCLSEKALLRAMAELATPAEQAHLAACATCAARWRKVSGEMGKIREVLLTTPEPFRRVAPRSWRSMVAAAGLAAAAVGALVWVEVAVWKTIQPGADVTGTQQVEAALADVTAAIFSVDGDPPRAFAEAQTATPLDAGAGVSDPSCDEQDWLVQTDEPDEACSDNLSDLEALPDSLEADTTERTVLDAESASQGG